MAMASDWITPVVGWLCLAFGLWVGYAVGRADRWDDGDDDGGPGDRSCRCHQGGGRGC